MKPVHEPDEITKLLGSPQPTLLPTLIEHIARTRTLLNGHFELLSGEHTEYFVRFAGIGYDPEAVRFVASNLIQNARAHWKSIPTKVLAAESASVLLARAISDSLGTELVVAAIDSSRRPKREYRFGSLRPEEPTLIVSDVVTTGSSLSELMLLSENPVGVVAFCTLSADNVLRMQRDRGVPITWLATASWRTYHAKACPLCSSENEKVLPASEFN